MCGISDQIAIHCNQEIKDVCFICERLITEDESADEVMVKGVGWQLIHDECLITEI